jgi:hypothetical protein
MAIIFLTLSYKVGLIIPLLSQELWLVLAKVKLSLKVSRGQHCFRKLLFGRIIITTVSGIHSPVQRLAWNLTQKMALGSILSFPKPMLCHFDFLPWLNDINYSDSVLLVICCPSSGAHCSGKQDFPQELMTLVVLGEEWPCFQNHLLQLHCR